MRREQRHGARDRRVDVLDSISEQQHAIVGQHLVAEGAAVRIEQQGADQVAARRLAALSDCGQKVFAEIGQAGIDFGPDRFGRHDREEIEEPVAPLLQACRIPGGQTEERQHDI